MECQAVNVRTLLRTIAVINVYVPPTPDAVEPPFDDLFQHNNTITTAGRSGLAVACLTAVREVLGSTRAVGSCVYRKNTVIYSLGHGLCAPFVQCLGQLSLLPYVGR